MNNIKILDCTLRDGGYVNNWDFPLDTAREVISDVYDAGVRIIEVGLMASGNTSHGTKFTCLEDVEPVLVSKKADCRYAVMATVNEISNLIVPDRKCSSVDIFRIAFFKEDMADSLKIASKMIEKGYEVFLQPMATFMYSEEELRSFIDNANGLHPSAVYMVDSFSNLYPNDVRKIADIYLDRLDDRIGFGFHAHNNIQMAYANVIEFMSSKTDRDLYVDGSIFGMGRGAGNVPVELIMEYLNKNGSNYNIVSILKCYQNHLKSIYKEYGWGYSHEYYLTASKCMNSVYGWYLMSKGINNIEEMNSILDKVTEHSRHFLNKAEIDSLIKELL